VTHPPVPTDTHAYRRGRREQLCAELSAAAYDNKPRSEECYERFCNPSGATGNAITLSAFAYLDGETGYICFRGTHNVRNWLSDFHVSVKGSPRRHRGFDNCWRRLQPRVVAWLARHKPRELILTGHSLGGAIAQIAAFELAPGWLIRAVVCYGAPLVGLRQYAAAYDAAPINGRPGTTLGEITTTYVFKSDRVRFMILPLLGYKFMGQTMSIDEAGRTGEFYPWFHDALAITLNAVNTITQDDLPATTLPHAPSITLRNVTQPPRFQLTEFVRTARPVVKPFLPLIPHVAAAAMMLAGLFTAVLSAVFLRRDISYHSARMRYARAMTARLSRWLPLAYNERGEDLLRAGNPADAVPCFSAALDLAEADAWNLPEEVRLSASFPELLRQYTWRHRLNRAEALKATGDYPAAIADLTSVIDSYRSANIQVPVAADGAISVSPQVLATQSRAVAFEMNKQLPQAMADYAALITAKPDLHQGAYFEILETARRRFGAASSVATVVGYRKREVNAETDKLLGVREQVFRAAMTKTFEWAHYRRAVCALQLKDYATVLADSTAAIEYNSSDAWAYNLRAVANQALKNHEHALTDFTRSIELEPGVAGFWFARAYVRMTNDATLSPIEDESQMRMLSAHVRTGDIPLIEADLRRTLELEPSHSLAHAMLQGLAQSRERASTTSAG
jgi:tetratricopeptide (TPR) repeat protein